MVIPKLEVESDSRYAITIVGAPSVETYANLSLARSIKELETRLERVKINHVYRESNFSANTMAKLGYTMEEGHRFWASSVTTGVTSSCRCKGSKVSKSNCGLVFWFAFGPVAPFII
ncbi:hypothetical protein Ahy_A09g045528 [Arachis hypogaea]|uniref:RNase H type-1 domain-containing protein n=1 Tax=Arachis hypogaea TaxID=3818 RepID=A0A445BMJ5_ARAHY|nr:hypothetical protein Ahy_A09g045528 [Arachis hypogaea]